MKKFVKLFLSIIVIEMIFGINFQNYAVENKDNSSVSVAYNTHIQNNGWEKDFSKQNGETSGTVGKSLRLEGIKIKLKNSNKIGIRYQAHVQNIGWQNWKHNGELSGTTGKSLRLEGIRIELENNSKYSVMYRAHVQNLGWQDWKYDGEMAGTTGKSLRLEAIEIKIVNKVNRAMIKIEKDIPDVVYTNQKIPVSGYKMTNTENTEFNVFIDNKKIEKVDFFKRQDVINDIKGYGTSIENPNPGFNFQIDTNSLNAGKHNLKIEIVTKTGEVLKRYIKNFTLDKNIHIKYSTHIQDIGWQGYKQDGQTSGTQWKSLRIEAINIEGINLPEGVKVKYQTHVQDIGWQNWKENGQISGTSGQSKRLEAIRINLENTDKYSIMYRTHIQDIGWQDWCYDGETSGTYGLSKRLEAIEIKIVPKITDNNKVQMFIDNPNNQIENKQGKINGWIMSNYKDVELRVYIDNNELSSNQIKRYNRNDVINAVKGYGNERIYNQNPAYEIYCDFSKYNLGTHKVTVKAFSKGNEIGKISQNFIIRKKIEYGEGIYGYSGLKINGDWKGKDLKYYKYGNGPNVFFAAFAIHGFEDKWDFDGWELIQIADEFYQRLIANKDYDLAEKWTIYIIPGVNQDGLNCGWTNNGPGRTTLYSKAPGNKGIDLNRCWQVGNSYRRYTDSRNYNGTAGFQAYEAQYLRNFLLSHKSQNGQTLLVDLHGWTQQLIGDSAICSYYNKQFPENNKNSVGRYGTGYLINWARNSLGSNGRAARSALIELPDWGIYNHQSVINNNISNRYIDATLDMLRNM